MPDPPNYAFEPQSPRDSGCGRMVLAGLLGVIVGVLLTIVVEATILPGLFDRVHDFHFREAEAPQAAPVPAPVPTKALNEEAKRRAEMSREIEERVRQQQKELEEELKRQQEEVEGKQ